MADSSRTIMTDAGFALETRVRADETKMKFTRATISTDDHFSDTDDALAKLTELSNIQQDGKVTAVQVINTTTVYVQVDVNQAESKADYQMRSAALYAKDDDGTEVLYGVTVLQDPVFVHKDADGSYLGFGINTTVGKASNVVVVVDPANMVTQQVFEGTMKNYYTKAEVDAKFVTDDDFASKLPKNIATTDAANTFAKSQTLAGGATDGKGNAYATTKDVATGLNNGLNAKVTDNKNGTEQLNGVQVQPFNKLSDTIGGRNYLINTQNPSATNPVKFVNAVGQDTLGTATFSNGYTKLASIVSTSSETFYRFNSPSYTLMPLPAGTYTLAVDLTSSDNVQVVPRGEFSTNGKNFKGLSTPIWKPSSTEKQFSYTFTIPSNATGWYISLEMYDSDGRLDSTGKSFQFRNASIQKGDIVTDSSPAPEDKVNVSDMRKPASDVAGIEEVSAKQDKIGYTPADDSKVVHDNHDNTITANSSIYDLSKSGLTSLQYIGSGSFNGLPLGTVFANGLTDGPNNISAFTVTTFYSPMWGGRKSQIAIADAKNIMYFRVCVGSNWNSWTLLSDDSKVVHTADMRKPASDVAGIEEVNAKQDKIGYTPADDSKVVHRSPDTGRATDATDFPYKDLTVDGYPVIPFVLVPDRATALAKTAQYPNYAFMYGKELN